MTLTFPVLNRSRQVLWLVTGSEKAEMLARLRDGDRSIPAGTAMSGPGLGAGRPGGGEAFGAELKLRRFKSGACWRRIRFCPDP